MFVTRVDCIAQVIIDVTARDFEAASDLVKEEKYTEALPLINSVLGNAQKAPPVSH